MLKRTFFLLLGVFLIGCSNGRKVEGVDVATVYTDTTYQELLAASARGDVQLIETLLLEQKLDPNKVGKNGITPLIWAIKAENYNSIEALLKLGANPNQKRAGYSGAAVTFLSRVNQPKLLELVLKNGGNPNSVDGAKSALTLAFFLRYKKNAELLLKYGAVFSYVTEEGNKRNVVFDCYAVGNFECILYLLELGAEHTVETSVFSGNILPLLLKTEGRLIKESKQYHTIQEIKQLIENRQRKSKNTYH